MAAWFPILLIDDNPLVRELVPRELDMESLHAKGGSAYPVDFPTIAKRGNQYPSVAEGYGPAREPLACRGTQRIPPKKRPTDCERGEPPLPKETS